MDFKEKIKTEGTKKETNKKESQNKYLAKISLQKRQKSRNNIKQEIYKDIEEE